jgi:signal transduction histidine kinase
VKDGPESQLLRALPVSAVEERRLIERALHDGVQQDLIGISVGLQLVSTLVATAPDEALTSLDEIRQEVKDALGRLRTLSSDIYPAILDARGLSDALRQAARASRAAASVQAAGLRRYPVEIEAAVFFLWRAVLDASEAGANARIHVFEEAETLRVGIEAGASIERALATDLVEAAEGTVRIRSGSGGCTIEAEFPRG